MADRLTQTDFRLAEGGRDTGRGSWALLVRQSRVVLLALCALSVAFIAWAATLWPASTAFGAIAWAAIVFRGPILKAARGRRAAGVAPVARGGSEPGASGLVILQPGLTVTGRLTGASRLELGGRFEGEVDCDVVLVRPQGRLSGRVVYGRLEVADGARLEGEARPRPGAGREPIPPPAR